MDRKKFSVLRGVVEIDADGTIFLRVFCPWCDTFHTHGWKLGDTKPTHKVAHCAKEGGPFEGVGYLVAPYRNLDWKVLNLYKKCG
jgi:hypothetical protein